VVQQKAFLFSTTIKENMAFTKTDSSDEEIIAAAQSAAIHDFIQTLPKKYETLVGEKGVTLSGGQKQRVALARTLLSNPDILVLDDSTSAVDAETEFAIQTALKAEMKDKTTFIIAHRLTSIQQANKIIVFDEGEIIEMGTHEKLLHHNGFYKKVYDIQVAIEDEISNL
jgi:ABC-type multidrug transport system fused ATPase/permease subunit